MKTIFTFILALLISATTFGQNMFVHTATAGNISADATYIDHPDLNNNPAAQILISHNWNPPGSGGIYNDNVTGVFYSNSQSKWGIYNESSDAMVEGSSYNVYIGNGDVVLHIADLANQASNPVYSVINHPNLNGNPDAQLVLTTYFTPNGLRNDHNYSVWYNDDTDRWNIFPEDLTDLPLDTAFFLGIPDGNVAVSTHHADVGNISGNYTTIDHPLLNGDPDAVFVFTHNWGISGGTGNVIIDHTMGAWYTGSNWAIYTEDLSAMPENAEFDLMIYDPSLGLSDSTIQEFSLYPNPVNDQLSITSKQEISTVAIYNILGQEITSYKGIDSNMNVDVSALSSGTYIIKVQVGDALSSKKFIKL